MKSSGLNKSGISPAHVRKQRNRKSLPTHCLHPIKHPAIVLKSPLTPLILCSLSLVVVGHSEDHARNPVGAATVSDEMQINQY